MPILARSEARAFYDRLGARQDTQWWYEDPATDDLVAHADFAPARAVFELGCGTGRFAHRLLEHELSPAATYAGVDLSPVMVDLARKRLAAFGSRAGVRQSDGDLRFPETDAGQDRFVCNYVLDLLSEADIRAAISEAARMLADGGLLCVASLGAGRGPVSKGMAGLWRLVHRLRPAWLGGCRPLDLAPMLAPETWHVRHRRRIVAWGIPSEVIVAARRARA